MFTRLGAFRRLILLHLVLFPLFSLTVIQSALSEELPLAQWEHKSWGLADGAPHLEYDVLQGRDGILWLSTPSGLYRFDGIAFTRFTSSPGMPKIRNYMYALFLSRSGVLWADSYLGGVVAIDGSKVTVYGKTQGLPIEPMEISESPDGSMWGVAAGHLYQLRAGRWLNVTEGSGLPDGELVAPYFDRNGLLWVITNNSIFFRLPGHDQFAPTTQHWDRLDNTVAILQAPDGGLWIALANFKKNQSVVYQLDVPPHPAKWKQRWKFNRIIYGATFDRRGSLWITGRGITRISFPETVGRNSARSPQPVLEHIEGKEGWSNIATHAITEDNAGDMWVTTTDGIERFRIPVQVPLPGLPQVGGSLALGRGGEVWIGAMGQPLRRALGSQVSFVGPPLKTAIDLCEGRDGRVWFRSYAQVFSEKDGRLQQVILPNDTTAVRLSQILQLPDSSMLFSFFNGTLWRLDRDGWHKVAIPSRAHEQFSVVYLDSRNRLWLGDASGQVTVVNPDDMRVLWSTGVLGIGTVYSLFETPYGMLVGGEDGIDVVQRESPRRLQFANYLMPASISGITTSDSGDIWLNSEGGIIRIPAGEAKAAFHDPGRHLIQGYTYPRQGLASAPMVMFNIPTAVRDATGRLWFTSSKGVVSIDPRHAQLAQPLPILMIGGLVTDGTDLKAPFIVSSGEHTIRIPYFGANLANPNAVRYRYVLTGVDHLWQDVGSRTEAVYTRLGPGRYTFKVTASNGGGLWTPPASIEFRVLPAFYQSWWFASICVVCSLLLLRLAWTLRIRYLTTAIRIRAEERAEERVRLSRDLHDTLLQGLQGLLLSFHVAAQKVSPDSEVHAILEGALSTADRILIEGRDRLNDLRSEEKNAVAIQQSFKSLANDLGSAPPLKVRIEKDGNRAELRADVADEVFNIAREAVTNAVRHAKASEIGLDLVYGRRNFSMTCTDNGCGFSEDQRTQSQTDGHWGLQVMAERAKRIGGRLVCHSAPGRGTSVKLTIPAHLAYARVRNPSSTRFLRPFRIRKSKTGSTF